MPTPPASTSLAAISMLPALSVVLGLPLCEKLGSNNGFHLTTSSTFLSEEENDGASSYQVNNNRRDLFAERAKANISRLYARRVINRARLERQHPWGVDAALSPSSKRLPTTLDNDVGSSLSVSNGADDTLEDKSLNKTMPSADQKYYEKSNWKDELLTETLVSLIKLKERMEHVKSLSRGSSVEGTAHVDKLLDQLGLSSTVSTNNINRLLSPINNNHLQRIANCESISSKQRTLNEYNSLQHEGKNAANNNSEHKPAEWSDDIDLVQKRLEFGKEISPLSNTTRLERWGMAIKRIASLGMLAAPLGVMVPINLLLGNIAGKPSSSFVAVEEGTGMGDGSGDEVQQPQMSRLQRYHTNFTQSTWDYALWATETAGPTYIKLVQWASTRNDLFSPEFVGHFSKLQDETRGHSWKETEATLLRAFGKDWRKILSFDKVIDDGEEDGDGAEGGRLKRTGGNANRERQKRLLALNEAASSSDKSSPSRSSSASQPTIPIGSGCVAQVYKARLTSHHGIHPPGTSVAVKVQHPRILEKVCLDFYILNKLASALEYIPYLNLDYLSMKDSVDQFRDIMLPQLDLRVEAHNLQRFRRDFEGESQIAFPEPFLGLTSREVLVERFVEGEPMLNFVLKEDEFHSKRDREELATIGLETVMKMIFLHDFVHADLHPGNMIVDRNKSVRGNPLRMHMIDCGLTVELGERDHMNLVKILGSLIKRDGYAAGKLMVDTAKKCQATELDVEMFCKGIEKICVDDEENNFLESVGDYITDICYLACKHKVKLEAAFINAALACEIMEGLASSLYPDMKVQRIALPMVLKAEMMHHLWGPTKTV